jgi:hypothetical protein
VHDVASVEPHVSVEVPPLLSEVCAALSDAVGCLNGVTPAPPHAANSRDAPKGKKNRTTGVGWARFALSGEFDRALNWFDRIDIHPTNHEPIFIHELTVIESPRAVRYRAMFRRPLIRLGFLACRRPNIRERPVLPHYCKTVAKWGLRATR